MTSDSSPTSDSQQSDEPVRETVGDLVERLDEELASVEREADGVTETAVEEGRELLADLSETLHEGGRSDGFEEYDTVDVSEAKKRP